MKKIVRLILFGLLSAGAIAMSFIAPFYLVWSIVFVVCVSACYAFYVVSEFALKKYRNIAKFVLILVLAVVALFVVFYYTGLLSHFTSLDSAREWFESFGVWSWIAFFIIQLLQVVVIPIPAQITTVAGVLILGAWTAFVISSVATILGSLICFGIGKLFGVKVAYKLASQEVVDKYRNLLTKKGKLLLPVMFIFPAFPDDLLCFVAGTTKMTWRYFFITTLLTRLIGVACICWFGSGDLIPFSGWGIPVWIVIGILMAITLVLLFKYQEQIETFIITKFTKHGKTANKKTNEQIEANEQKSKTNQDENLKIDSDYINFGKENEPEKPKDEPNKENISKNK